MFGVLTECQLSCTFLQLGCGVQHRGFRVSSGQASSGRAGQPSWAPVGVQEPAASSRVPASGPASALAAASDPSDFGHFGDRGAADRYWAASQDDSPS